MNFVYMPFAELAHTYTNTHACMHTTPTRTHTPTHTRSHTHTHMLTHPHAHPHTPTHMHAHTHTCSHTHTHTTITRRDTVVEAENYMNIEMKKIMEWTTNNRLMFNENKSRTMFMSRRRKEKKEIEIYIYNTIIKQENTIKYIGIIFDSKLTSRDHINHIEEKCLKLIFSLSRSAKITRGLIQEATKTIYIGGILPLVLYGTPVWKSVLKRHCYKAKLIRIQRHKFKDDKSLPHGVERGIAHN